MVDRRQQLRYKQDRCGLCPRDVEETIKSFGPNAFHKVFQFHHVDPEAKHEDYDNLIRRNLSTEQLDELDKCVLLCNWCHGLLENQNNRVVVHVTVSVGERTATQDLHGQVLVDQVSGRARFVTNERLLAIPYRVYLGDSEPRLDFGTELETGMLLVEYLGRLPEHQSIAIGAWRDDRLLLEAKYLGGNAIRVKYDVNFPILKCELRGDTTIWTRNGLALTDKGDVMLEGEVAFEGTLPNGWASGSV